MSEKKYRCIYKPCKLTFIIRGLPKLVTYALCCPLCQAEVEEVKQNV